MSEVGFPNLYEPSTDQSYPVGDRSVLEVYERNTDAISLEPSGDHSPLFRLTKNERTWSIEPSDSDAPLLMNESPVDEPVALDHLSIIQAGSHVLLFREREDPLVSTCYSANLWMVMERLGQAPEDGGKPRRKKNALTETIAVDGTEAPAFRAHQLPGTIELAQRRLVIGRDSQQVDICLEDPRVSRVHAAIHRQGKTAVVTDLQSANGTFVDGERVVGSVSIQAGSHIHVGPYRLIFGEKSLFPLTRDNNVELIGRNLVRRVNDRTKRGQKKVILDDVTLVLRPKQFVCILGPSGSGKTTLLSALSARVPADEGQVLLNGDDLYAQFDALKYDLAVVPQKDVLHDILPLNVALRYTARLRLPADMTAKDIEDRIDSTLDTVNLVQRQYTPIRQLSGGQIRRASWANEAICNPSLIFLDEVTSGLDEQTDAEMMRMFRRMADEGKTIVCVTHSLSYVEQNCNLVVILAAGGVLAFVGTPADALEYFSINRLGDVYQRLGERQPSEWKSRFRASEYHRRHVTDLLPADSMDRSTTNREKRKLKKERIHLTVWKSIRQTLILIFRGAATLRADKRALAMIFGQCIFIAALLVGLFGDISNMNVQNEAEHIADLAAPGISWEELLPESQEEFLEEAEFQKRTDRSSKLLFLLCVSCVWFGCNNAAKEFVKERDIFNKERDVGLKILSYYVAKLTLYGTISILQALLLFWISRSLTHLGGSALQQATLLSLTAFAGVAMGLAISSFAATEDVAVTVVPMALIPQIILAGLIAPLGPWSRPIAEVCIPAYWSYQGLMASLETELQTRLRDSEYLVLTPEWTVYHVTGILLAFSAVFGIFAIIILRIKK